MMNLEQAQFVDVREFERDAIVQTFGVPPEVLGNLAGRPAAHERIEHDARTALGGGAVAGLLPCLAIPP